MEDLQLRRADVEVDIDMENGDEVYLWGAYVTDRDGSGFVRTGYHPFFDWSPVLDACGAANLDEEVAELLASTDWVDLERLFREELITGHSTSVKTVAKLIGFDWSADDPGGGRSMLWYRHAVDPKLDPIERDQYRERVLTYNCDDVRAMLEVREWWTATNRSSRFKL